MAASSNITSPLLFMLTSSPSWNSMNKSKICLQRFERCSNKKGDDHHHHQHVIKYSDLHSNLKTRLQAQALVNGASSLKSLTESLNDEDITTEPAMMELLKLEGRLIKGGRVFQQTHFIRSFEIDHDYRISTWAIMNILQEASVNYRKKMGMSAEALLLITPEMRKRDLLWVLRRTRIEVDRYPSWADVIQVYHWFCTSGRTGLRLDWIITDMKTGETLVRASSLAVMMNKKTRKTCKLPEEVKEELKSFLTTEAQPIVEDFRIKYSSPEVETMNYIRNGLTPGWHDLDFNYHVNNAKFLDWIFEGTPPPLIYTHELCKINLEYRKECLKDDMIQSLSRVDETDHHDDLTLMNNGEVELEHVLRLENGPEVARARTAWRPKSVCQKPILLAKRELPIN